MSRLILIFVLIFSYCNLNSQVRFGWRSIYDTSGRLTRMNFYENGVNKTDSNYFFQYHTDNVVKGIVKGEITKDFNCKNGSVMLFDETGSLTSFKINSNGQSVYLSACEYSSNCSSNWVDQFDAVSNCWEGDSIYIENSELVIQNDKSTAVAIYNPTLPVNINNDFIMQVKVPAKNNSSRLGVVFGWKDRDNFKLLEIQHGDYFSLISFENGNLKQIGNPRIQISKKEEAINELIISRINKDLIVKINGIIEMVMPVPQFAGDKIGLYTRSKGKARFNDFIFQYTSPKDNPIYSSFWIGKGTGFFITNSGKILTTYDAIADAKKIRIKGIHDGKVFTLPAEIISVEEVHNLAILKVKDQSFLPFDKLPFGYNNLKPISESAVFSIGFPNAVSGIIINPEVFSGKILPSASYSSTHMLLEMSFRYGMIGSPIFDSKANLIGVVANKGMELKYTEGIDFYSNARLFQGHMGLIEKTIESPIKNLNHNEMVKALSEVVVIIESSVFDIPEESEY